jgi:hypothetical protein
LAEGAEGLIFAARACSKGSGLGAQSLFFAPLSRPV